MMDKDYYADQEKHDLLISKNGHPLFSKVVLYGPNEENHKVVPYLDFLAKKLEKKIDFFFVKKGEENFLKDIHGNILVVSSDPIQSDVRDFLFQNGIASFLDWKQFLIRFSELIYCRSTFSSGQVGLAFLPGYISKLLSSIFRLYGYRITLIHSISALEKMLNDKLNYIVIDQDIGCLQGSLSKIHSIRDRAFKMIISARQKKSIYVSVIKDFEKGCLFDDIISSVKEFCNLLLSPYEYILFIKHFLYCMNYQKISGKHLNGSFKEDIFEDHSYNFRRDNTYYLNDPRRIYSQIMDKVASGDLEKTFSMNQIYTSSLIDLEMRELSLKWLDQFLDHTDDKKKRASFNFVNGNSEEGMEVDSSNLKSVSDQQRNVSPHSISHSPKSPNIFPGGPK